MQGRIYAVTFENVSITASQDLFYAAPADDKPLALHGVWISQYSDLKDTEEEGLRIKIIRGHATVGSGGTTPTPTPLNPTATAAGFVARVNDTTIASAGTAVDLYAGVWINRTEFLYLPPPEQRPIVSQAAGVTIVVRLMAAPADALSTSGTAIFEELA